ncbi:MAG: hypothetical protein AAF998_15240 [Bacteroidota bacterium]
MKHFSPSLKATLLLLFFSVSVGQTAFAASYDVFLVRGDILYEGSGEQLECGAVLASGERIKFSDPDAFAVLIGEGARYTLSGKNLGTKFKAGEFFTVKSATKRGKTGMAARPAPKIKELADIKEHLGAEPFLILGEAHLPVSMEKVGLAKDAQFFLRFKKAGELVPATVRTVYRRNTLVLDAEPILNVGSPNQLSEFKLMLFSGIGQPHEEVAAFDPVLINPTTFGEEINGFVNALRTGLGADGLAGADLKQHILDYLVEYYGRPEQGTFDDWVEEFI